MAGRYNEPARLHWRGFFQLINVTVGPDGRYPQTVTVHLATILDPDTGLTSGPVSAAEGVAMQDGWVFRLRPGCGCEPIYDADEPPWVGQIRSAMRRLEPAPAEAT